MSIFQNTPLLLAIFAILFAQGVKLPIHFITHRKVNASIVLSTGGMPSSHSAAVCALTTAIAFENGLDSSTFAIAAVFAMIVMFDATGIRFQAGQHAQIINEIRRDFQKHITQGKAFPTNATDQHIAELKTMLGHKPSEMFFGALTGIFISVITYTIIL